MSTATAAVLTATTEQASVSPTVIENALVPVTAEQVEAFCDAIIAGTPTTGLLPARVSLCDLSDSQRDDIKTARKAHEMAARLAKQDEFRALRRESWALISARSNASGSTRTLKLKDESYVAPKRPKKLKLVVTGGQKK